jgi:N-acetylglutamate synthase-like GNAT family acetyltransferase
MCEHMKNYCKKIGLKEIFAVTSPQAKEFYEKMGAIQVAEVESLLKKGRIIPKLKFNIEFI